MLIEIYVLDLLSTSFFAFVGGVKAVQKDLGFVDVVICSFLTAVGGGILRDFLIGEKIKFSERYLELFLIIAISIFVFIFAIKKI